MVLRIRTGAMPNKEPEPNVERLTANAKEAAKMIGISSRMLFKLTQAGELPCKRIGRRVLYSIRDIRRFIDDEPASNWKRGES